MPINILTLGKDPSITYAFLDQLDAARPGMYTAWTAHDIEEFETLAKDERDRIDLVLLGAAQTEEQVREAREVVGDVWGDVRERRHEGEGMWVLRMPPSLLTEEGKKGGMVKWFLEQMDA